ncbi:MAG: CDP-diacylglycerol--glycerol-3-phosphate 3-phosphatidyltransferase [Actinomycetota bacterium]|nr:CDP-diacylglycerol--glycerol-3-phosphate 3-phosphatidyltransferase [Actinomycetota bacterium]MDD5667909.1 CDP-diacylglycerol--glycerol-3-phosphate 3-phosphatidyltransferase [Actinomycetota bacterium]
MAPLSPGKDRFEMIRGEDNWNLPNALTFSRVLMAPLIAFLLSDDGRLRNALAAATVGTAAFTDFLDGHIARRRGKETKLGQFLDPLADKICISTTFVMLAVRRRIPAWAPGVIIGREVAMTLFRVYAGSQGSSVPASIWGKLKTNSQLLAVLLVIMERETPAYASLEKAAVHLAVALTLYSGLDYMLKASRYLDKTDGA